LRREQFDYCEHEVFAQRENLPRLAEVLVAIRDDGLYGSHYRSFDDYVLQRFGWAPELVTAIISLRHTNR
jgi:hypothetical protein